MSTEKSCLSNQLFDFDLLGTVSGQVRDLVCRSNMYVIFSVFVFAGSYYGPTHGDPSYMKSEISMESETSLSGLEDVLIGPGGGQPPPLAEPHAMFASSTPTVNPIDKLYSMQTSYFSNNECECLGTTN